MSQIATYAGSQRSTARQALQESPAAGLQVNRSRVESKLLSISMRSLHDDRSHGSPGTFEISANLDEVGLREGRIDLRYKMSLGTTGRSQEAELSGMASV